MSEMIKIPEGWESVELGNILKIETGSKNAEDSSVDGIYPFFTRAEETQKINTYSYDTEALFIAGEGNFRVKYYSGKFEAHQRTYVLTSKDDNIDLSYLQKAIQPKITRLISTSVGSTVMSLRKPQIAEIDVLSPKQKKEQQKIAEVLSEVDNAISKTEELFEKNRRIKTALMQDLLSYGIDENGKIRSCETHKFKPSELGDIPEEWEIKKLKDIGEYKTGLTFSPNDVVPFNGTLVLRSTNIVDNKISLHDNVYVKKSLHIKYLLKEGDILICVRNGSRNLIGKNALITKKEENMAHGAFMSVFQTKLYFYVFHLFQSNLFFKQIEKNIGATINSINNGDLIEFIFPFPKSKNEQQKIAQILSSQDEKIEDIKNKLNKLKSLKASLMQDLLSGKVRVTKLMEENS